MKKVINFTLTIVFIMSMFVQTYATTTYVDDVTVVDVATNTEMTFVNEIINIDGVNLFPMRELLNDLGVENEDIIWHEDKKIVEFSSDYYYCAFQIGTDYYYSNDETFTTTQAPIIVSGTTYMPIRYVANSLGYYVEYDPLTRTIYLTDPKTLFGVPETVDELVQFSEVDENDIIATFDTNYGQFTAKLFPEYAPLAVENFVTLSQEGYYDGLTFHRVIEDFVIQGGDPSGDGSGGESIYGEPFENEINGNLRHFNGALAMANAGEDTNGSQFYIVSNDTLDEDIKSQLNYMKENPEEISLGFYNKMLYPEVVIDKYLENGGLPSLDFSYTIFGQVVDGMDIIEKINQVETNENDKPLENVIIKSISIKQTK